MILICMSEMAWFDQALNTTMYLSGVKGPIYRTEQNLL